VGEGLGHLHAAVDDGQAGAGRLTRREYERCCWQGVAGDSQAGLRGSQRERGSKVCSLSQRCVLENASGGSDVALQVGLGLRRGGAARAEGGAGDVGGHHRKV